MIINDIKGNTKSISIENRELDKVELEWFEREKRLLKKTSTKGIEIGINVCAPLNDGDILYIDNEKVIVVDILPTDLIYTTVDSKKEMGRLCFELGNRHLPLIINEDSVVVPYDEPTYLHLCKIGFNSKKTKDKFTNYSVCHAHGHSHE